LNNIINGKFFANQITEDLAIQIKEIYNKYKIIPKLAIIIVGNDERSLIYVQNKLKAAAKINMDALLVQENIDITTDELINKIDILNNSDDIHGIIVQLPLPLHINKEKIIEAISPLKDVDGFHPINVGYLHSGSTKAFVPCTALGVVYLLKQILNSLEAKSVTIVGRSNIVGKPVAALLTAENSTVTICHSRTKNLNEITLKSDIIITAIGSPKFFTREYFSKKSIIIDVGISRLEGKIVGDVDFDEVSKLVQYISPVPGGVGPMTIAFLLKNTFHSMLKFCNKQIEG